MKKRILADDIHKKWLKDPAYREAYDNLADEFALAAAVIEARGRAGLTQEELAERMGTTQPVVARLESGRIRPSTRTLERLLRPPARASSFASSLKTGMKTPEFDKKFEDCVLSRPKSHL